MGRIPTVKVATELFEGGFMIINEADFDPEVHELFEGDEAPVDTPVPDETEDADETPAEDEDGLPEGYQVENAGGPYMRLYAPSGAVIPGPANGKWQGRQAAVDAANAHAAG